MSVALALLLAAAPFEARTTYLLSVVDVPLLEGESLADFSFATWGVDVAAVCRIPPGWTITAGRGAAFDGTVAGEGSHGVTWFRERSPAPLADLVLVSLDGPVRREEPRDGGAIAPATFRGKATLARADGERKVTLTARNVRLVPAGGCPAR